jgi:hypothetical protein
MYDNKAVFPTIINAGKYCVAIIVAVTSFFASNNSVFRNIWWLIALLSTIYSYIWDIKKDFGFLQPGENYPLREKLSYKNKLFYYVCLITNLFLRCMWVLTVSPDMVYRFIRPEFFMLFIYSAEVLRRGMWNFIRVEYQHIELCKVFKVTIDVDLPFKKNEKGEFILKATNQNLGLPKVSRRLDKLRTAQRNDTISNFGSVNPSTNNLVELERALNDRTKKVSFIEYESTEYRRKFGDYLEQFNKNTENNIHNINNNGVGNFKDQ